MDRFWAKRLDDGAILDFSEQMRQSILGRRDFVLMPDGYDPAAPGTPVAVNPPEISKADPAAPGTPVVVNPGLLQKAADFIYGKIDPQTGKTIK